MMQAEPGSSHRYNTVESSGSHMSECALFLSGIKDLLGFGRSIETPAVSLETWVAILSLIISSVFSSSETTENKGHGADGLEGGGTL